VKVSFVIPTIGRPADLQRFIDHLQRQEGSRVDLRETELIVVDQSGQPETGELLARQQTPFRIQHLPMAGRGAARARNYGWSFARGEILSFPDDDCHYPPQMLHEVLEHFADPQVDGLMVQVEHVGRQDQLPGPITRANVLLRCLEAGLFVRREKMDDLRYDECMGIGADTPWNSDEGPDLLLRMLERGLRIEYAPELVIHHPNPLQTLDARLLERTFKYSRGRGYLLRKHRFPVGEVLKSFVRPLGGSILMALTLRWYWARYYLNSLAGRWVGWSGGKGAPVQRLTSPLSQPTNDLDLLAAAADPQSHVTHTPA
jgi:glycosyltransferase involved in cell wall biosynthesis